MSQEHPAREAALEFLLNIILPTVVLLGFSSPDRLGPLGALVGALVFPFVHAGYAVSRTGSISALNVIAVVSILLTGGIGLFELDPQYFALKEGVVSLVFAALIIASMWSPWPAIDTMMWLVFDAEKVRTALERHDQVEAFSGDLRRATWGFALIMVVSAALTWGLAGYMVTSPTGTEAFNKELGIYTAMSFPLVTIPVWALMFVGLRALVNTLEERTDTEMDHLLIPAFAPKD